MRSNRGDKSSQLRDVVITIASTETVDGVTYAFTQVYRYDLAKKTEAFIKHIEKFKGLVEGGQMCNYKR